MDAPCSGDGTLRKSPAGWISWRASEGKALHKLQRGQRGIWVVVSEIFYVHPYLGKISILTSIFFKWVETTNQGWVASENGFMAGENLSPPNRSTPPFEIRV